MALDCPANAVHIFFYFCNSLVLKMSSHCSVFLGHNLANKYNYKLKTPIQASLLHPKHHKHKVAKSTACLDFILLQLNLFRSGAWQDLDMDFLL